MKTDAFNAENMRFLTNCANERFGILKVKDWLKRRKILEDLKRRKILSDFDFLSLLETKIGDLDWENITPNTRYIQLQGQYIYKNFPDLFKQNEEQE